MAEVRNLERPGFLGKLWGKTLNAFGVSNDFQEDSTSWADAVRNSANYISPYNVGHGGDLEPQVPQAATDFVDSNKGMMERMGRSDPEPMDGLLAGGLAFGIGGLGRRVEQRAASQTEQAAMLKGAGYSGVDYSFDTGGREVSMFDPRNIRSVNAAFDPSKSDSADLLAANANPFGAASDFLIPPLAPEDEEFGAFGDVPKR